jgi:hypothetical protein
LPVLVLVLAFSAFGQEKGEETAASPVPVAGWDVSFTLMGPTANVVPRRLFFMSFTDNTGTFRMTGPRTTWPVQTTFPAVWAAPTPTFMSFSGEVEFPIGNCCRETGTLIFKGDRSNTGVISGAAIFVTNVQSPANPVPYIIRTGTFVATPVPIIASQ